MGNEIGSVEGFRGGCAVVLGDTSTAECVEALTDQAAECGTRIAEIFAFGQGEAVSCDDIAMVDVVVAALAHAIAIGADVWVPFPENDFYREQHSRRIALALERPVACCASGAK